MTGNILHLTVPLIFTLRLISVHQECYLTQHLPSPLLHIQLRCFLGTEPCLG